MTFLRLLTSCLCIDTWNFTRNLIHFEILVLSVRPTIAATLYFNGGNYMGLQRTNQNTSWVSLLEMPNNIGLDQIPIAYFETLLQLFWVLQVADTWVRNARIKKLLLQKIFQSV